MRVGVHSVTEYIKRRNKKKGGYSKFYVPYQMFWLSIASYVKRLSYSVSINYGGTTSEMVVGFRLDGFYGKKVCMCLRRLLT